MMMMMNDDSPAGTTVDSRESARKIPSEDSMPDIDINFDDVDIHPPTSSTRLLPLSALKDGIQKLQNNNHNDLSKKKMHANDDDDDDDDDDVESDPNIFRDEIPENATNVDEVDATIVKQMMELSVDDREKVYMDVHGVKEGPLETEEDIQAGLESMRIEIDKLQDKQAYDLACSMDQQYVENRSFRLAFLRSENFDARKAAIKIVRHFQLKLDLFGEEKLALDIVQDDLDRETMDALYSGREQFLHPTDRAGRSVFITFIGDIFSSKAMLQRGFYNSMVAHRNPERQIHSVVVVTLFALSSDISPQRDTSKHWRLAKIEEALPFRIEALHFCHNGSLISQVFSAVVKAAVAPFLKIRTRTHCGTHKEVVSSLAQYGIAQGTIPVTKGFKVTNLEGWGKHLRELRSAERLKQPRRQKISVPTSFDVLFGKGTPFQKHPGNVQLRTLVSERYKSYEKAVKGKKMSIAQEIVETIQQKSGLFLRPDSEGSWVCVGDEVARKKVSTLFRTLRVKMNNNK